MASDLPPPRSADPPPPSPRYPTRGAQRRTWEPVAWVLGVLAVLLIGAVVVIFSAGEYLIGSDPGTIDSYNSEVLESCEVPSGSELVQISIRRVADGQGRSYRSMWYVYASPLPAHEVAEFFGVTAQQSMLVSQQRACRFEQRPSALVLPMSVAGEPTTIGSQSDDEPVDSYDGLWADHAAEVTMSAGLPAGTQSLFRLRLAQAEVEGIF
jgi:hypothetical protein